jgi:hypothetical protein
VAIILKPENLARFGFFIRSEKVMLDSDLARLYGVEARAFNQAVARNRKRFPADFMFQLTPREYESLRSQTVISNEGGSTDVSQSVMSSLGRRHERLRSDRISFLEIARFCDSCRRSDLVVPLSVVRCHSPIN